MAIVGQSVAALSKLFGIPVPPGTRMLIGEVTDVGRDEPWAYEKLSPLLAMYRAADIKAAVATAKALVEFGGAGHTAVLYTNTQNTARAGGGCGGGDRGGGTRVRARRV